MRKSVYSFFSLFLFTFFLLSDFHAISAQEKAQFTMEPVGDEAFRILVQFYTYDRGIPLDARIVETIENPAYTREKIVFRGAHDSRVPGYLAIPKTGKPPYPCILQLHGHTGNKAEWWQDDSFYGGGLVTKAFLPAGFAVLALDAQYHGERMANNDYESPGSLHKKGWYNRSIDMIIQSIIDYRRALDYLATRSDIDTTRIGVHGYSMGGMMTFILTGVEPRVRVAVSCVTWNWNIKDQKYSVIAPYNFTDAIGSRPFLMLMGRSDPLLPAEAAQQLFNLIKSPSAKIILMIINNSLIYLNVFYTM